MIGEKWRERTEGKRGERNLARPLTTRFNTRSIGSSPLLELFFRSRIIIRDGEGKQIRTNVNRYTLSV